MNEYIVYWNDGISFVVKANSVINALKYILENESNWIIKIERIDNKYE